VFGVRLELRELFSTTFGFLCRLEDCELLLYIAKFVRF
jgi:hypothetical protein